LGALPPQPFGRGGDRPHRPHGVGAYDTQCMLFVQVMTHVITTCKLLTTLHHTITYPGISVKDDSQSVTTNVQTSVIFIFIYYTALV